ncbi:MAG: 1,4-dihydroxy-2-naphthoate octaprenyltransferase [Flavobacteriaceae bacterium]|nr:1,4-dihydroxy-2-naphthoate octaprenyltransferase [Flavobacteriaceae bacterium]
MLQAFIKAARLRTLPLSVSGILIGSSIAYSEGYSDWNVFTLALLTTIGFQVLSNFANDYGDGVKGTDNKDRVGPQRAVQSGDISPGQMLHAIKVTGMIVFLVAVLLIYSAFGLKEHAKYFFLFLILGIASIAAAVKYTMGNKAYGYSGYGDIFVFLFFGWLSVVGSYFLFTKQLDFTIFLPATSIGMLSVGVLNLNNMRDRESDEKAGKRTLVVKIGEEFAKYYHYYLLIGSFLLALVYVNFKYSDPKEFLFVVAYIPIGLHIHTVYKNKDPKDLDPELKKLALSTFLFAILLSLGFIL